MDVEAALRVAEELWEHQKEWKERVEAYAVEKLLSLKNSAWLEDDEEEVSPEIFKSRISLATITVDAEGFFSFWYDDDGLFDHSIHIEGNPQDGITDASIEG
jgi:hypothetical protein